MPLYEYQCDSCESRFERIQKFSDPPVETCPSCGGTVKKLLSSPAIQFKGSGWYITDYAKKPASDAKPASAKTESSTDTGSGSSEPAASKESKDSKDASSTNRKSAAKKE
jgi:putative FmdB family regulatory protein